MTTRRGRSTHAEGRYNQIRSELTLLRLNTNTRQADLAARIGVAEDTLSTWEPGTAPPTGHNLINWAHALGYHLQLTHCNCT